VPVADSSPTADTAPGGEDGEADTAEAAPGADPATGPQLTATAGTSSGDTSTPWGLIGGGLAVGLLGAGLAFAPSRRPPLPQPPPMNPTGYYPGY
ncbi:MAG TPA: hypothetical protein VIQ30_08280, partial [Pseudonocardia sp.]